MPLAPVVSVLARQTLQAAFDELDQTINPTESREFSNITIADVEKSALEIEDQLAARQSLRNMRRLMPLFRGLEHYAKVMGILCHGTRYLSWVWAPINLILRTSSECIEAFEHIVKGYSRIAEPLGRFEVLDVAYARNTECQQTLATFYADILQFHKQAYRLVHRNGKLI